MKKFVSLLLPAVLLLCACQKNESAFQPEPGAASCVTIAMAPSSEPASGFDPAFGWGAGEHVHEPLIQSTLTITKPDLTIGYDLAVHMEVSPDGLLWTVPIRGDVKFTDGQPLTASDVAFTYNTVKESSSVTDLTMLDYAEAQGDTVLFHMKTPFSIWPYTMAAVGILPEHAYDPASYGSSPIGSGRYILKQWDRGQQVIFQANSDYYGEPPKMDQVTVLFLEEDAAYLAVQAGQVDLAYTSAVYSGQSPDGYSLLAVDSVDNRGINLPVTGNEWTCRSEVRQAINLGINRQAIIDQVLNGYGSPAYSVCDGLPWYNSDAQVDYDPEQAAALLENLEMADGYPLTILYPAGDSGRQAIAAAFVNQLQALGIPAELEGTGWDTAYDRAQTTPLVWGWGAHTPMELYNIYHTMGESAQYSPYSNPAADAFMDQALSASLEDSYALWQQAQSEILEDLPWVWLVNVDHLYWVRDSLQVAEQKIHPHGHGWSIVNNVDQWSWQ